MNKTTRRLAYLAVLVALNVVLTRVASLRVAIGGVEGIRIGFGGLPVILAGVLWGPGAGALVGGIGDVVGYFINPMGAYMPHFTLTAALTGAIPALVLKLIHQEHYPSLGALLLGILVGQTVTSLILVPYFLESLFGIPWRPLLMPRIIGQAVHIPAYAFFIYALVRRAGLAARLGLNHE